MKQKKLLLLGLLMATNTSLLAGTVRMKTGKAVGETFSFAVNTGLPLTLTWGNGTSEEVTSTGQLQSVAIKDATLQIGCEQDITALYVADNGLTELNVSGIASTLRTLCCANNQLTALSLAGCTNLVALDCQGNQLTTLSVPSVKMQDLNIADNQLSTHGLTTTSNLLSMVCANNKISTVSYLANMTKLTSLFCQGNQISTLSLNRNVNLKHLLAYGNKIRTLTFKSTSTGNTDPGLTTLEDLWISDNQLSTIDISDQTALVGLVAANNGLGSITWFPYSNSTARSRFKYLDISDNMLCFSSLPNVYSTLSGSYTIDGAVAPQKEYALLGNIQVNEPTSDDFKALIARSAWNTATRAEVKLTAGGTELQKDVDYKYDNSSPTAEASYRLTFLTAPHENVVLTLTSPNYPGLEIVSLPFNVLGDPSGIDTVESSAELDGNARIYDLQGRLMDASSLKKGIYIVNGKKVIIR